MAVILTIMRVTAIFMLMTLIAVTASESAAYENSIPVHGLIIDKDTCEGIECVAVSIIDSDIEEFATTDSLGCFVIHAPEGKKCRICAFIANYGTAISEEFIVSTCPPFVRIEMTRQASSTNVIGIPELIELAELTYVKPDYDSVYFINEVARIEMEDNIKKAGKGQFKTISKIYRRNEPFAYKDKINLQYMLKPERISITMKASEATETSTYRRPKDFRRLKASQKVDHNNA